MARLENNGVTQASETEADAAWQEPELALGSELETLDKRLSEDNLHELLEDQSCCGEKLRPVVIEGACG